MDLKTAYERWEQGEFADEELSEISGLAIRSLRDLAKWGAIETSGGGKGRGKRRKWKRPAICKAAMTAAFQRAGLPLPMGARLAFHFWNLQPNNSYDPFMRFPKWEKLAEPFDWEKRADGEHVIKAYLTDDFANARHDEDFDSYVHIINGVYVIAQSAVVPYIQAFHEEGRDAMAEMFFVRLGRLSDDGNTFLTWHRPRRKRFFNEEERAAWETAKAEGVELKDFLANLGPRWDMEEQYGDEISLDFLQYQLEPEANEEKASKAFNNFTVKTSVNVTLAMRTAMRRAIGLPVVGE